jgi:hypothetical protein
MDSPRDTQHLLKLCRALILQRQLVTDLVGSSLCANPVWDMLLDLYVADREGLSLYIWPLSVAGKVPISSAHRKIDAMVQHGLVVRTVDESDRRRVGIQLSEEFRERLENFFDRLMRSIHEVACS